MAKTKIEWTEKVWNPITGCTQISVGCRNCYAKRMANRLKGRYGYPEDEPFRVTFHPDKLGEPQTWKKPSMIFICSMGDLFHKDVSDEMILTILKQIPKRHTAQILTKRPERMADFFQKYKGDVSTDNLWCGTTIENKDVSYRAYYLSKVNSNVRFISFEPLLDNIAESPGVFDHINWVIVGGETGIKPRTVKPDWVRNIRDICTKRKIPFFFKKWGNTGGRELDGENWNQLPLGYEVLTFKRIDRDTITLI